MFELGVNRKELEEGEEVEDLHGNDILYHGGC